MQAGLRAWSAAGVAAILPLPARQTPRVSWCPRARTQSGMGALPGTREWRHEPVLQIRPSVEAPGERRDRPSTDPGGAHGDRRRVSDGLQAPTTLPTAGDGAG